MMKPEDLHPPEVDLTDGLPRKSTEPSTIPFKSVVPASSAASEIDIASPYSFVLESLTATEIWSRFI